MTHALTFIGLALVFTLLKIYLEKRFAHLDAVGDEQWLDDLAFVRGCSVYDLFKEAGSVWRFSQKKIDADFRQYVHQGHVPPYLHDFLEKQHQAGNHTYRKILFCGGRPPYL